MSDALSASVAASVARLRAARAPGGAAPRVAVLLGSGWGPFVDRVRDVAVVSYAELPAFPAPRVGGHEGRVVLGRIGPHRVALLAGREHAYETGEPTGMKGAIRTLAALGVQVLVQTNAAGSLDPEWPPGTPMLIADHLNLPQRSPLVGEPGDDRFVAMADAYDPALRAQARAAAARLGTPLAEGVYAWVLGPQFETPAEIRMLRLLGARAVGMSTVPETILARHAGLRVLALSLLTNMAAGMSDEALSHAHTLAVARTAGARAAELLDAIVGALELP